MEKRNRRVCHEKEKPVLNVRIFAKKEKEGLGGGRPTLGGGEDK